MQKRNDFNVNCNDGFHDLADVWKLADGSGVEGIRFFTFLCNAVMLTDFQVFGRWPRANDRVKGAERGSTRAAEKDFRTFELMPSGPVADL